MESDLKSVSPGKKESFVDYKRWVSMVNVLDYIKDVKHFTNLLPFEFNLLLILHTW